MKKPTAILMSDLHLRDTQPICRKDDFWEIQKKKLKWLKTLHKDIGEETPVFIAGDIFHEWKTSPKILNMAIDNLPKNIICIPGNHEMPSHTISRMDESGYNTLMRATKTGWRRTFRLDDINIHFFPYGSELKSIKPSTDINIALVHFFVYKGRKPFPGQLTGVKSLMKQLQGYDLIHTGDNHHPFTYKTDDQLLINPGCFSRQKADEALITPRVYIWYEADNSYDIEYVPIEDSEKVISRKHLEQIEYKNEKIEIFVGRLNENIDAQLDFKSNMKQYLEGNPKIRKLTKVKIQEAMQP